METRLNFKILVNSPDFKDPEPKLEQYATPVDTTLEIIKKANSRGHLRTSPGMNKVNITCMI